MEHNERNIASRHWHDCRSEAESMLCWRHVRSDGANQLVKQNPFGEKRSRAALHGVWSRMKVMTQISSDAPQFWTLLSFFKLIHTDKHTHISIFFKFDLSERHTCITIRNHLTLQSWPSVHCTTLGNIVTLPCYFGFDQSSSVHLTPHHLLFLLLSQASSL